MTLVGIFNLGSATSLGGATIVGTTFQDAQQWYDRVGKASTVNVLAEPGVSQVELESTSRGGAGHGVKVQTGPRERPRSRPTRWQGRSTGS